MNLVQCLSHSIEEADMLRLYARIGVDAFSLGGYIDPQRPHDDKRPPVFEMAHHRDLHAAVDAIGSRDNLSAAQYAIPEAVLDWAETIVYHHHLHRLYAQWPRIRAWLDDDSGHRVIWRSIGQSVTENELAAVPYMNDGLDRVLYSPKERNIPGFSGGNSPVIRFGKDPAEWTGWTGEDARVLNISQHDSTPHGRDMWLNWSFWEEATAGLPRVFAGPNTEKVGGLGKLPLDDMKALLRSCRVYLYTGTQPASYTLGLIEAMMTGIPVVSIGPERMTIFPFGPLLFEGRDIVRDMTEHGPRNLLQQLLDNHDTAKVLSWHARQRAIDLFGIDTIAAQWADLLGVGSSVTWQTGELVTSA